MTEAETRAAAWLQAWDAQSTHRTGTEGDAAGAGWLAGEARAIGAEVTVEQFAFDRLDPVECWLEIGGARIEAVPVFDAPSSGADGIVGALGGDIAVAELTPRAVYSGQFQRLRREGGHRALVVVCQGDAPGLGLINAEDFRSPYGDSAKPPLVVMTPRSSWWQSTAERGGGLVCWLESLRALMVERPGRDVVFTANTGHELGHLGLDDFVARRPGWDRPGGAVWVHYGANIGAFGSWLALVSNNEELRRLGLAELRRAGQPPDDIPWPSTPPSGETRDIHKAGGRYLTLVGTYRLFHLPQDRWPDAVDVPAVARIAAASAAMVVRLSV
jgi:hypothetical protein